MPRRKAGARVEGPYYEAKRERYKVRFISEVGARTVVHYRTEAAAKRAVREGREIAPTLNRTVGVTVEEYELHLRNTGRSTRGAHECARSVRSLLDSGLRLFDVSAAALEDAVYERLKAAAVETVRSDLRKTKTWLRWCARRRYVNRSLLVDLNEVIVEGRSNRGKEQLTLDESRRYVQSGCELARMSTNHGPTVALMPLLCGLRAGEILQRQVRDVDDGGHRLIVQHGKTARARRVIELPTVLFPLVQRCVAGKVGTDLLFPGDGGRPHYNSYLRGWVHRLCDRAGVPRVCPHGLRGTHATLAVAAGAVSHAVAGALGHASDTVTKRHYSLPSAVDSARVMRVQEVLA